MRKIPTGITGFPDKSVSPDDTSLFAFVNTLRLSVRARVAAEQSGGMSLAEIVIRVREMVRVSVESANHSSPRASPTLRAITRQAVAWCLEAYRPPPGYSGLPRDRFPQQSPT